MYKDKLCVSFCESLLLFKICVSILYNFSFRPEIVPSLLVLDHEEAFLCVLLLVLFPQEIQILLIVLGKNCFLEALLKIFELLKLACKFHILLHVVESMPDESIGHLKVLGCQ